MTGVQTCALPIWAFDLGGPDIEDINFHRSHVLLLLLAGALDLSDQDKGSLQHCQPKWGVEISASVPDLSLGECGDEGVLALDRRAPGG